MRDQKTKVQIKIKKKNKVRDNSHPLSPTHTLEGIWSFHFQSQKWIWYFYVDDLNNFDIFWYDVQAKK